MLIQSNYNAPQRQNFGIKVRIQEPVLNQVKKEMMDCYEASKNSPYLLETRFGIKNPDKETPDPQKIWEDFVATFEKRTEFIDETLEFITPTNKRWTAGIKYTEATGQEHYLDQGLNNGSSLLPNKTLDQGNPYETAYKTVMQLVNNLIFPAQ